MNVVTHKQLIWIATAALASSTAHPQHIGGRVFEYECAQAINMDVSSFGDVFLDTTTDLKVKAYLYVAGSLGVTWNIGGWGTGVSEAGCTLTFYHNETLSFDFENFGDLQKVAGSETGLQTIPLEMKLMFANNFTGNPLHTVEFVPATDLNSLMTSSSPIFPAGYTDGQLALNVLQRIALDAGNEPGTYVNPGQLYIVRT